MPFQFQLPHPRWHTRPGLVVLRQNTLSCVGMFLLRRRAAALPRGRLGAAALLPWLSACHRDVSSQRALLKVVLGGSESGLGSVAVMLHAALEAAGFWDNSWASFCDVSDPVQHQTSGQRFPSGGQLSVNILPPPAHIALFSLYWSHVGDFNMLCLHDQNRLQPFPGTHSDSEAEGIAEGIQVCRGKEKAYLILNEFQMYRHQAIGKEISNPWSCCRSKPSLLG